MKAKILPLQGKYYGTEVEIDFEDGYEPAILDLWECSDPTPSPRELASHNITHEQWENDERINEWGTAKEAIDTSHFENRATYLRALLVIAMVAMAEDVCTNT